MKKSVRERIENQFPFDEPRQLSSTGDQIDMVSEAIYWLYSKDYDNVIIDAPTGTGKSGINVTIANMVEGSSFYITPQKKLREQLQSDEILSEYYRTLKARADYTCNAEDVERGTNCNECPINARSDEACSDYPGCTYWNRKMDAIDDDVAVLTFAYLIIDGVLPVVNQYGDRISFGNRDLLIVDECHGLERQTAQLFAGFTVSPYSIPLEVFGNITSNLSMNNTTRHHQVTHICETLQERAEDYIMEKRMLPEIDKDTAKKVKQCERFLRKMTWFSEEIESGRDWVVDMDTVEYDRVEYKSFKLKPVKVDKFLRNFIWDRADKRVLSTATMPYRGEYKNGKQKIDRWLNMIGLPGNTHIIDTEMPFPKGHRPIHTDTMIASMSNGGVNRHWNTIMDKVDSLAAKHSGEKGVIHCASYGRGERLWKDAESGSDWDNLKGNVINDRKDVDSDALMRKWQDGNKDIFVSPAVTEGVDLEGDQCRWQVLLKVPFPSPGDPRVEYLLEELPHIGWEWYYENTATQVVQSVGRAIRSKDDYADYYVLDEKFNKIRNEVVLPDWFVEAIDAEPTYESNSALSW